MEDMPHWMLLIRHFPPIPSKGSAMCINGDKKINRIISMKLTISRRVVTAWLLSSVLCMGNTSLNNEQREFLMVQSAFIKFQKDTNRFPTSWDDLWNNPASRSSVEWLDEGKSYGRRTDTIESFRFIASGTTILLPKNGARVIGMMTRPMRPPPEIKRRFLIVELKDGTRGIEQIREEALQKIFLTMGLNLADYTGPNGNWVPETRLRPLSEIPPPLKPKFADSSMDHTTIPALPLSKMLSTERKKQLWIVCGIAIFLLIAFCVWQLTLKVGRSKKT